MRYLSFILLFFSMSVFGETAQECAKLVRTDDRLACFDSLFPSKSESMIESETVQTKQTANVKAKTESSGTMDGATSDMAGAETREATGPMNSQAPKDARKDSGGLHLGNIFNREPNADFESRIKELKAGLSQKMVFLLENNEIWLQSSPRTLPFRVGDSVTVKRGLLGGYVMRSEGGTSTRVQRIK